MKAVILAAAEKDSLFPFTESKPAGMLPVAGVPVVRRLVNQLEAVGVDETAVVVNHLGEEFRDEFSGDEDVSIVRQEDTKGTGHAVSQVRFEEDFFVLNGDLIVSTEDLRKLKKTHLNRQPEATVLADSTESPEKFGVLSVVNDEIRSIEESPESAENALVNTGVYVFKPRIFDRLEGCESHRLTDTFESIVEDDRALYNILEGYWMEVNSLRNLWKADKLKRERETSGKSVHESAEVHEGAELKGDVRIEKGAVVRENSTIEGPAIIGSNSVVGPGTLVHHSTVGENCQIRHSVVEGSVVFDRAVVDPNVHLERTVLGEEVDVRPGTVIEESFIGSGSFVEMNNSVKGTKFVPDARTDLGEISK